ncbi:hypothetical protein HK405_003295, partial [Cladochytrium tenue]
MTRPTRILGPRPDPTPSIPAAGAVEDSTGLDTAKDCLDHGDRVMFKKCELDRHAAHIPGCLPRNITDISDRARAMVHGVRHVPSSP